MPVIMNTPKAGWVFFLLCWNSKSKPWTSLYFSILHIRHTHFNNLNTTFYICIAIHWKNVIIIINMILDTQISTVKNHSQSRFFVLTIFISCSSLHLHLFFIILPFYHNFFFSTNVSDKLYPFLSYHYTKCFS